MDLNEIAVFVQVVQSKSFRQAAIKLGMPNSTVSHKVSSLEKRLGITLIQRTTRKLSITPAGELYYRHCLQSLESIKTVEQEIASGQEVPQGLLRVTAPQDLGSSVLPDIVSRYIAKYPKTRVEILLGDRVVDLLSESVDLAIRAGQLKDSSLIAKRIGTATFGLFASQKYIKAHGAPDHPRELTKHDCLLFTPFGTETWRLVSSGKGALNVPMQQKLVVNDLSMIKRMAMNGDGIAAMPIYFCKREVEAGKLIRILPDWRSDLTPVHFVYPAQRFVSPKLKAFMDLGLEGIRKILSED